MAAEHFKSCSFILQHSISVFTLTSVLIIIIKPLIIIKFYKYC